MFKDRVDWPTFILGIAWCAFFYGLLVAKVGTMTEDPYLITWWDAIWMPFVGAVMPFLIGVSSMIKLKKSL